MMSAKKRAKLASSKSKSTSTAAAVEVVENVLNPNLSERIEQLKNEFKQGKPFPNISIPNLCTEDAARKLHEEIKLLQGTQKETDLFRVIQTGDLANADESDPEHAEKLKYLLALRRDINSDSFRKMVEEITGCGPLSTQVDLSANAYVRGCHLLCHDDVIGSRRVSYIVYLSDPDDAWLDEDGGRLELYPSDANGLPEPEPSVRVLPSYNSLAMFVVEPGVSYHSVEEVFTEDKPRISLQGWFHATNSPPDYEKATLQQILNPAIKESLLGTEEDIVSHIVDPAKDTLSEEDLAELKSWVNPVYLNQHAFTAIREKCASEDNCVSLHQFISTEWSEKIKRAIKQSEESTIKPDCWKVVGPAHLRRHLELVENVPDKDSMESYMLSLKQKLSTPAFTRFLHLAIGDLVPIARRGAIRRFRKGSDYTVAYAHQDESVVDCTLCFVLDDDEEALQSWRSGEVGGFELYLNREEDGKGDVAVYSRDQESEGVVAIDPTFGALCLVYRDDSRMRFIKYLSKIAPTDRYDISLTYKVQDVDGEDVDDDDEDDEEQ